MVDAQKRAGQAWKVSKACFKNKQEQQWLIILKLLIIRAQLEEKQQQQKTAAVFKQPCLIEGRVLRPEAFFMHRFPVSDILEFNCI